MRKLLQKGKKLYWWLIATFAILYLAVAFVSTLHAITFFQLANTLGLAILLGAAYEVGQATVLFSILMSQNRNRVLAWAMMFLLTGLQVTANVYASFKFIVEPATATTDWTYWQRAILFGVQAENDEMYQVIISWISGALLPLVALGMTALVADNIKIIQEGEGVVKPKEKEEDLDDDDEPLFKNPFKRKKKEEPVEEEQPPSGTITDEKASELAYQSIHPEIKEKMELLTKTQEDVKSGKVPELETASIVLKEPKTLDLQDKPAETPYDEPLVDPLPDQKETILELEEEVKDVVEEAVENIIPDDVIEQTAKEVAEDIVEQPQEESDIKPVNKMSGWHFMNEFVDNDHNVFHKGKYVGNDPTKTPTAKKA